MNPLRIYVASKSCHGPMWRRVRAGLPPEVTITSTWIDESDEGENLGGLWERCIDEARNCHFVVAYHEAGEQWKGAYVEIGVALAHDTPVYVVGDPPGSWTNHRLVQITTTVDDAITWGIENMSWWWR